MVFSSAVFLVYFLPILFLLYCVAKNSYKNTILLLASIIFYSWGGPRFIFVILITTLVDFILVNQIHKQEGKKRKFYLILSVCINLGLLFYFKYFNFFLENFNGALTIIGLGNVPLLHIVLPIGISFYTFESITYVVDVYRRVHAPLKKFHDYLLYILFFPKLIAGPIVRFHEIADQITARFGYENVQNRLNGLYRFVIGLSKKVLIANTIGAFADTIMDADPSGLTSELAWLGLFSYTLQIYFDFSGYSDMAIGISQIFGFRLPENFNNPYTAISVTDFWRRWHITLGAWMRNYLYIPLGGNKVTNKGRLYLNLWIVFLASGFWHGASWNFILWGSLHGLMLIFERVTDFKIQKYAGKVITVFLTFVFVMLAWALFRIEGLDHAMRFYKKLFSFELGGQFINADPKYWFYLGVGIFFSLFILLPRGEIMQVKVYTASFNVNQHIAATLITSALFLLCLATLTTSSFNPFIYFRF